MIKQNHALGIMLSFAGYTAWVGGDTVVKLAGESLPIAEILSINFLTTSLFTVLMASLHGGLGQLSTKRPKFHIMRSIFIMGATYGSVAGVIYLSLADFYTIIFTSPLVLTALGSLILKEKVDCRMWLAIIFGFLGVIVAVQFCGANGHTLSWIGIVVTSIASLSLALTMLTARAAADENNYALSLWPEIINCVVSVLVMLAFGKMVVNTSGIIYAVLSGIMGGIGLLLTNASLRVAPVAVVSPYHYTQIIGGAVIGYLIWHHVPALSVIIGAIMIIASGLYILRVEQLRTNV